MNFRSRAARTIVPVALLCALDVAALVPTTASAATVTKRDQWQVSTAVGPRLEADGGNLFRITPAVDRFTLGNVRWIVTWANFSGNAVTQQAAMRLAAEDGTGALIDRPLTAAEARRFTQRVAWREADVLLVHPENPVCTMGVTTAQATGLLTGTITSWTEIVPADAWPSSFQPEVHGYRPAPTMGTYVEQNFGVTAYGASLRPASEGTRRNATAGDPQAFAPVRYSAIRGRTGFCGVPIDGVRPDDTTVRAATYPASWKVYWIFKKVQTARSRMALNRFTYHLFGPRGTAYLRTEAGRNRLR